MLDSAVCEATPMHPHSDTLKLCFIYCLHIKSCVSESVSLFLRLCLCSCACARVHVPQATRMLMIEQAELRAWTSRFETVQQVHFNAHTRTHTHTRTHARTHARARARTHTHTHNICTDQIKFVVTRSAEFVVRAKSRAT